MTIRKLPISIRSQSQVVKLPTEAKFSTNIKKVFAKITSKEKIINPSDNNWNNFFLNGPQVSDDFMKNRNQKT